MLETDLRPMKWSRVLVQGMRPSARIGHSGVALGTKVVVYGGRNLFASDDSETNQGGGEMVHILQTDQLPMKWTSTVPSGTAPLARTGHSAVAHPSGFGMIILGGMQPETKRILAIDDACYLDLLGGADPAFLIFWSAFGLFFFNLTVT